ncbi:hypothetical protein [Corallibacter sp.]|uniref:hypothetical protein n=1 Tax=Corallibacter sp. TaxID=2038084 RepID=UPI003AB2CBFB
MKTKNLFKTVICLLTLILTFSCSSDDDSSNPPADNRSIIINPATDYFINIDGTVNFTLTGTALTGSTGSGNLLNEGVVYGTSSNPDIDTDNTAPFFFAGGVNEILARLNDLTLGTTYFARGYFEYDNGDVFYGDQIQFSTDIDASSERAVTMDIEPEAFLIQVDFITVDININDVEKEMPVEIGVEYSVNSDFSNSSMAQPDNYEGLHNNGEIAITSYSVVAEPLQSGTQYYFRPYAKYADETITNGGTSTATFTTN